MTDLGPSAQWYWEVRVEKGRKEYRNTRYRILGILHICFRFRFPRYQTSEPHSPNQSTSPLLCPNQDPRHLPFCSTDLGLGTPLGSSCSKQLLHRLSFMKTEQKLKCKEKAHSSFHACFLIFIFLMFVDKEMD